MAWKSIGPYSGGRLGRQKAWAGAPFPLFKSFIYFYVYEWFWPECVSVQCVHTYYVWKPGEAVLELELKKTVSCHMGPGNLTQVFWKSSQRSEPLSR